MGGCAGQRRGGVDDAAEHDRRLPQKQLEDLPFQPAIAERHSFKVALIECGNLAVVLCRGHQTRRSHDVLPAGPAFLDPVRFSRATATTAQMAYRTGKLAAFFHADSKQTLTPQEPRRTAIRRPLGPTAAAL